MQSKTTSAWPPPYVGRRFLMPERLASGSKIRRCMETFSPVKNRDYKVGTIRLLSSAFHGIILGLAGTHDFPILTETGMFTDFQNRKS